MTLRTEGHSKGERPKSEDGVCRQLRLQGEGKRQARRDCHLYPSRPPGGAKEQAVQLESAGTYLREGARRGGRWVHVQLALFGGGRRHEPIAVPSAADTPPTTARATLAPSSGRPRPRPRPSGKLVLACPGPDSDPDTLFTRLSLSKDRQILREVLLLREPGKEGNRGPSSQSPRPHRSLYLGPRKTSSAA